MVLIFKNQNQIDPDFSKNQDQFGPDFAGLRPAKSNEVLEFQDSVGL